jgi:protoporphyrinogen oxidase
MVKNFEYIIIGSGFRALITAFFCLKKSKKVLVISNSKNLSGVLKPIKWEGASIDKGYQFFDGLDEYSKNLLEDFVGKDNLTDFGYGAASLTNGKIYSYHAIPFWPHHGFLFTVSAIFQTFLKFFFKKKISKKKNILSYEDLIRNHPSNIKKILNKACQRNFSISSEKVSFLSEDFSPFLCYRLTLFKDKISYYLKKKFKSLDRILAIRRDFLDTKSYSLYPKRKNMGYVAELMEKKLRDYGVVFEISSKTKISNENSLTVNTDNFIFNAKQIFLTTELDDILQFFDEKIDLSKCNYYVPQMFFVFKTDKLVSQFQYIHGNDLNYFINRASNVSLYGEKTSDNKCVIIAEVPMSPDSDYWKNPETIIDKIWDELKIMKFIGEQEKISKYKIFKAEKTFCLPLINFDSNLRIIRNLIEEKYDNNIIIPAAGKISRGNYIKDLRKYFDE